MKWPSQSLDLNPTENMWDQFATRVHEQNPSNLQELWEVVQSAWDGIPQKHIKVLVDSRPRCKAMIRARGEPSDTKNNTIVNVSWLVFISIGSISLAVLYHFYQRAILSDCQCI